MYGPAFYLLATSLNGAVFREAAGVGAALSAGVVAAVMALLYGMPFIGPTYA